jgi:hypothetical protein
MVTCLTLINLGLGTSRAFAVHFGECSLLLSSLRRPIAAGSTQQVDPGLRDPRAAQLSSPHIGDMEIARTDRRRRDLSPDASATLPAIGRNGAGHVGGNDGVGSDGRQPNRAAIWAVRAGEPARRKQPQPQRRLVVDAGGMRQAPDGGEPTASALDGGSGPKDGAGRPVDPAAPTRAGLEPWQAPAELDATIARAERRLRHQALSLQRLERQGYDTAFASSLVRATEGTIAALRLRRLGLFLDEASRDGAARPGDG